MEENPKKIRVESENGIKTITINNPGRKNSVDDASALLLRDEILASYQDGTRVMVLCGAGGDFSSGADLSGNMQNPKEYNVVRHLQEDINPIVMGIHQAPFPVIAKIRGVAAGMSLNFALACDLIYASPTAMFSQIFTNIGLSSDAGGAFFMIRKLGYARAFELMSGAARISAREAESWGLINRVVADEELDAFVAEVAQKLAKGPSIALKNTKRNLREAWDGSLASTLEMEAQNQGENFKTEDFIEGVMAFVQKRPPQFQGK